MSSRADPSETPREPSDSPREPGEAPRGPGEERIGSDPPGTGTGFDPPGIGAPPESLEIRVDPERRQGGWQTTRAWIRRFGDEIFWLIVVGIGWTLIVGTVISVAIVDGPAAFVVAALLWLVVIWRVLLWRHRSAATGGESR